MEPRQPARFCKKRALPEGRRTPMLCVVTDEEENEEEEESDISVAAALSKIDAGVALLVREVGVVALLCFYSEMRGVCVPAVFASRVLSRSLNSDASPQEILCGVSIMTADSAACILRVNAAVQAGGNSLRSIAGHPAPGDLTPVPRPPHTSTLDVPDDTTTDESQWET